MDTAVGVVKVYLELCGYFVLAELPVRRQDGTGYRDVTDLDVIAVRFPHAAVTHPRSVTRPLDVFLSADPLLGPLDDAIDVIVGEVKEGQARLNPALRQTETVAFALRRVGCCPEAQVPMEAARIAEVGARMMTMPGGTPCLVRLVAFGGHAAGAASNVLTITLGHCHDIITARLREAHDVLRGAQLKDPVLGLYALQLKVARKAAGGDQGS